MSDPEFIDGLFVKKPHERAPDFVKCGISIKRKELGNWLRGKDDEWINIQVKESKGGKWYAEIDNWKPEKKAPDMQAGDGSGASSAPKPDLLDDDIPFLFSGISLLGLLSYSDEIQKMLQMSAGIIS